MFEHENSSIVERFGLGLRRYFEHAAPPPESGRLYPAPEHDIWNLAGKFVRFHYSFSLSCDGDGCGGSAGNGWPTPSSAICSTGSSTSSTISVPT